MGHGRGKNPLYFGADEIKDFIVTSLNIARWTIFQHFCQKLALVKLCALLSAILVVVTVSFESVANNMSALWPLS